MEMLRPERIDLKRALIWEFQPRSPQVVAKGKGIPPKMALNQVEDLQSIAQIDISHRINAWYTVFVPTNLPYKNQLNV